MAVASVQSKMGGWLGRDTEAAVDISP